MHIHIFVNSCTYYLWVSAISIRKQAPGDQKSNKSRLISDFLGPITVFVTPSAPRAASFGFLPRLWDLFIPAGKQRRPVDHLFRSDRECECMYIMFHVFHKACCPAEIRNPLNQNNFITPSTPQTTSYGFLPRLWDLFIPAGK